MDKVFSARVDEAVIQRITSLARRLQTSKKNIVEQAVMTYAAAVDREQGSDVFDQTFGAWDRDESPAETVEKARETFRKSMERHRR